MYKMIKVIVEGGVVTDVLELNKKGKIEHELVVGDEYIVEDHDIKED